MLGEIKLILEVFYYSKKENNKLNDIIEEYGIKDMNDAHNFVKMLTVESSQTALDAELDEKHGYSKYDYKIKTQRIVAMAIMDKVL